MTNLERSARDGRADSLRSFDLDDDEPADQEGARLPVLVAVALLVLAAFAGVVWLAFTQGVERGRAEGPEIVQEHAAHKVRATLQAPPFTGLNIYQSSANGHGSARVVAGPVHPPNPQPSLRPTSNGGPESFAAGSVPAHPFAAPAPASLPLPLPAPANPAAKPARPDGSSAANPNTPAPAGRLSGTLLQIGSYKSEAEARQSWIAFKAKYPTAAEYRSDVSQVDLGEKGTWYRLRIGPFEDRDSAVEACVKLKSDGANCLVAR